MINCGDFFSTTNSIFLLMSMQFRYLFIESSLCRAADLFREDSVWLFNVAVRHDVAAVARAHTTRLDAFFFMSDILFT